MQTICVATSEQFYLPYLKTLIPNLVILGHNVNWNGFHTKYQIILDYIEILNDDIIITVIDAYDIVPTPHFNDLCPKFLTFMQTHPNVKMIIGHDVNSNLIEELWAKYVYFGSVNGCRLNGGQFIGYVKNIKPIISDLLYHFPYFKDDQIALTQYANQNKNSGIYIDTEHEFFEIQFNPLQQVTCNNKKACFLHANFNGYLDEYLYVTHNINIPPSIQQVIHQNLKNSYYNKINFYQGQKFTILNLIYNLYMAIKFFVQYIRHIK